MGMKIRHYLMLSLLCCLMSVQAEETLPHQPFLIELPMSQLQSADAPLQVAEQNGKRCMMVCEEWGEDCVVNPSNGQKDCRRVCVRFGEKCF